MSQPICPKCSAALKDDYGMVTCSSCGSFVFVDMDGIAHISRDEDAEQVPAESGSFGAVDLATPLESPVAADEPVPDIFPAQEFSAEITNAQEAPPIIDLPALELGGDDGREASPFETPAPESVTEGESAPFEPPRSPGDGEEPPAGELDMDRLLGFHEPAVAEEREAHEPEFGAPGDPLGINEYANSEISQAKDGLLTFKILISGIDSKEMRESLRSALDDQRFGWNASDLMSRISKGVLQIDNVASVKAVILINRIKRMPVKVRWEQYAITNMDAT